MTELARALTHVAVAVAVRRVACLITITTITIHYHRCATESEASAHGFNSVVSNKKQVVYLNTDFSGGETTFNLEPQDWTY